MQDNGMRASEYHVEKVKRFFSKPELYFKNRTQIEIRKIISRTFVEGTRPTSILDLGCGDGSVSIQFLSGSTHIVMVDLSEEMLSIARKLVPHKWAANVQFVQANLTDLHFSPRFDLVLCIGVLAHVPSVEKCIEIIAASLIPGGFCILQITRNESMLARLLHSYRSLRNISAHRLNTMTVSEIISLCKDNGLRQVRYTNYAPLIPGMRFLPNTIVFEYQRLSMLSIFSWIGSETMILLQKDGSSPI